MTQKFFRSLSILAALLALFQGGCDAEDHPNQTPPAEEMTLAANRCFTIGNCTEFSGTWHCQFQSAGESKLTELHDFMSITRDFQWVVEFCVAMIQLKDEGLVQHILFYNSCLTDGTHEMLAIRRSSYQHKKTAYSDQEMVRCERKNR